MIDNNDSENRRIQEQKERLNRSYILLAFCVGLLPSFIIWFWAENKVGDLRDQYTLITAANAGNLESDVLERLKQPDVAFSNNESLAYKDYLPVPESRDAEKIVGYVYGKYFMYVFYKDNKVLATFISKK